MYKEQAMLRRYTLISFLAILFFSSCEGDYEINVDQEIQPYFERFSAEGAERGVIFDNEEEEIEAYVQSLSNLVTGDVLGLCQPPRPRFPLRTIYIDEVFWDGATDLQKEYVVFHELGHCFLDREHLFPAPIDSLGNCMSIMAAGDAPCNGLETYSEERRDELLDELFSN